MDGMFERYACEFRAAHLVSTLTHSSHGSSLKICCRQGHQSSKTGRFFVTPPAALSCMVPGQLLLSQKAGLRSCSIDSFLLDCYTLHLAGAIILD